MSKERKAAVKKLDALCRKILLVRDSIGNTTFRCVSCRQYLPIERAQVGHYISRRYESFRWNLHNIHLQCPACNKWKSGNLIEYRKTLIEMYGEKVVEKMEEIYRETPHYSAFELLVLSMEYQEILKEMKLEKGLQ